MNKLVNVTKNPITWVAFAAVASVGLLVTIVGWVAKSLKD